MRLVALSPNLSLIHIYVNTPATVGALGTAVSQINQQVLRQIGVTIQNYERAKGAERSATHGKQPDLHEERRLPDPRPEAVLSLIHI